MFAVCEVMTDESLGSAVDRLAVFNDMMLEMNGEECLDHTYDTFLQVSGALHACNTCHSNLQDIATTAWNGPDVSFVFRPWLWQTCTEFGWYQTTNQVRVQPQDMIRLLSADISTSSLVLQETPYYGSSLPLEFFEQWCSDAFGADLTHELLERAVAASNVEYGGFTPAVTNVMFVHGSVDPWHAMGVLSDLSREHDV